MTSALAFEVVDAVVEDGPLANMETFLHQLKTPAGRAPSAASLRTAEILRDLSDEDATLLARQLIDASMFGLFYLLDNQFKSDLRITFNRGDSEWTPEAPELIEAYRMRVDPSGHIIDASRGRTLS